MREVIYKDEAYKAIDNCICDSWYRISPSEAKMNIRYLVSDAIEINRPQGKWILECDGEDECDDLYRCPFCGAKYGCAKYDKPNFCSECGADMRGEQNG